MNRILTTLLVPALLSAACGGSPALDPAPEPLVAADPVARDTAPAPTDLLLTPLEDDSAADLATLDALAALEFGSLDRRAPHVRGTLPVTPSLVEEQDIDAESSRLFNPPRGGAAAVSGPTYDINVTSFANHQKVQWYMDFFLGPARDRFTIWLGRLQRYEGMIRNRFRAQGIPEDMVYLALIESGYSNTAVSRARAVGMWQFMQYTGGRYGLKVDEWVDDRRDPFKATDAAARHLADLNAEFGSWYLAAAAYNGGAGRVSRGIRRLPGDDTPSDETFFELSNRRYLRPETRDYVPKLIAAALIAKEPQRYGFDSIPRVGPLVYDEIVVSDATGLDVLARLADTTTGALAELNPQFYRGVTPPRREVIVRVPRGAGPETARRWDTLPPKERVSFVQHTIARGETISVIARRYGVSQSLVLAANPGVRPRALRIGQRLTIPLGASAARRSGGMPRSQPAAAVAAGARPDAHVVRPGESLYLIGRRYGVKISELRGWNGLTTADVLKPGMRLRLHPSQPALTSSP